MGSNRQTELAIFREFAGVCPLQIDTASLESREPPEPDIMCSLVSGERIAFELVEAVDRDLAAAIDEGISIPRLLKSHAPPLPGLDSGARVGVIFGDGLSEQQKINLFPLLFEQLKSAPDGFSGRLTLSLAIRRRGLRGVAIYRGQADELEFIVTPVAAIADPAIEQVRKKFRKTYAADGPVELLVYYQFQPCFLDEEYGAELAAVIAEEIQSSQFRRVWAYDRRSNRVWEYSSASNAS